MTTEEIKNIIQIGLPGSEINVLGDGTHFEATIISKDFQGKTLLERHQLVYKTLGDSMREEIHALSLKTYTPDQWHNQK